MYMTKHSLFGDQVEAHLPKKLIFFQHHHGNWIHLLRVKVELHTSGRITQKISSVLSGSTKADNTTMYKI